MTTYDGLAQPVWACDGEYCEFTISQFPLIMIDVSELDEWNYILS